tara:strand:- start:17591 stop:22567 length:4977 start_codon:yes stop_codon:yes gene_type:complete
LFGFFSSVQAQCDSDSDNDGVCDGVDLDDDNDGILDEIECPNTYVSKAFQTSNGKTTTFLAPSADGGFQFDIFKLDNSFNLKVNGIDVVPNQIQCFGNGLAGESLLVFDSDNTGFGQGGNDQVWVINGDTEKPVVRLKIDSKGEITFEGKRSSGRELEPMKILSGDPQPLNIVWNTTGENEVVLSQKVDGPTNIAGEGHGIVMCTIDTDGDGIKNSLDTDSDGDGCQDALEGGAGFESTDLSGEVLSGVVGTNGVPVLAGNGQTVGTSVNDLQKAPVCDCDDNDGDGVCDDYDLDDDNDGILDIDECMTSNFQWSGVPSVNGKTAIGVINGVGYTYTSSINIETTPTIFAYNKFPSHYNIPNTTVIKNRFTSNNVITFDQPVLNPTLMFSSIGGGPTVPIEFSNAVEVLFQSGPVTINSPTKITGKEGYVVLRMNGVFNQISFDYLANENYVNFTFGADFATHCDTDGDGIEDYLDLDSDDDGCADAVEGDAGFKLSDINNDVLAGNVDANGVPVSAAGGQAIGSSADENTQSIVCEVCDVDKPVVNGIDGTPFYNFYFDSSKELNETVNGLEVGEKYKIKVSGTWSVWSSDPTKNVMDAAYRYKEKNASANITPVAGIFWQINGANANRPSPDGYNTEHTYYFERVATGEGERFTWSDSNYGDNGGGLNFEFYKVLDTIRVCPSNSSTLLSDYVTGQSLKWYSSEISSDGTATVPSVDNNQFGVTEFWVSQTIDGCESERAQILYLVKDTIVFDLGNDTTICEKESVTLNAPSAASYSWSTGENIQSIDVTTTGIYTVEISNDKGCKSSDSKEVNVEICVIDHFDEDTVYLCKGDSIEIQAKNVSDQVWGGNGDFTAIDNSTIEVSPINNTYYFVGTPSGSTTGDNIIVNGDFEQGGTGFTSGYSDGCALSVLNEGRYCVNSNPKATHSGFRTCGDHTSGAGNMMVVNAATQAGVSVWCQTVNVDPETDYEFSGWITSVHPSNPAILEFKINGALMGSQLTATTTACQWDQYAAQWNSGLNTSVEICLDNQNTASGGNDFAIDDISFAPVIHNAIGGDSILVIVHDRPEVDLGGNNTICAGDSITLKTSLAGTYLWSNNSTQSFINVKESGNYSLEVTNAEGCKGDTTVNITIQELPIVNLGNDSTLCKGDDITISASNSGASYLWNTGGHSQTINITLDGEYTVVVTDNIGCSSSDSIELFFRDLPVVNIGADTSICDGESVILDAKNPDLYYTWNTGNTEQVLVATQSGTYGVVVNDEFGCLGSDSLLLTVNPMPIANLGKDTAICIGETVVLNAKNDGLNYKWSTGESTQDITINSSGIYEVVVSDNIGCADTSNMFLKVNQLPVVDIGNDTTICKYQTIVLNAKNKGLNFIWNNGETQQTLEVKEEGVYSVEVRDSIGCLGTDEINVFKEIIEDPYFEKEKIVCEGQTILLEPDFIEKYNIYWDKDEFNHVLEVSETGAYLSFVEGEYCKDTFEINVTKIDTPHADITDLVGKKAYCFDIEKTILKVSSEDENVILSWDDFGRSEEVEIEAPGTYVIRASNKHCNAHYSSEVEEYCEGKLFIPNAFTPADDNGLNQVFMPVTNGHVDNFDFRIYNRWGVLIYQTNILGEGWDGTVSGRMAECDVYVYKVTYDYVSDQGGIEQKQQNGTVALMK